MENDHLLHKWVNGNLSEEELAIFKARPEYESLKKLYDQTEDWSVPDLQEAEMLSQILQANKSKTTRPPKAKSIFLSSWIKYAAAASILLFVAWFFLWPTDSLVRYDVAKAAQKEGFLPDQSSFVLNAESSLSYEAKDWKENRRLNLEGEAFFKVKKGSKFEVFTKNGLVQVLGTSFNVRSRNNTLEVKCETGKVIVQTKDGTLVDELQENDAIRIIGTTIQQKWKMQAKEGSSWITGILSFKKVTLSSVLEELERQFDLQIETQNIDLSEIISCNFQNKDLKLALETSVSILGISYEIKAGNKLRLYK